MDHSALRNPRFQAAKITGHCHSTQPCLSQAGAEQTRLRHPPAAASRICNPPPVNLQFSRFWRAGHGEITDRHADDVPAGIGIGLGQLGPGYTGSSHCSGWAARCWSCRARWSCRGAGRGASGYRHGSAPCTHAEHIVLVSIICRGSRHINWLRQRSVRSAFRATRRASGHVRGDSTLPQTKSRPVQRPMDDAGISVAITAHQGLQNGLNRVRGDQPGIA